MEKELAEIEVFKPYLPKQLDVEELSFIIQDIIVKVGATDLKDMGKVMALASKELFGRADNKRISECIKKLLG